MEALFNEGKLGELLVRAFGGVRGHTDSVQDSEFLVVFESNKKTPNIDDVRKTVNASLLGTRL